MCLDGKNLWMMEIFLFLYLNNFFIASFVLLLGVLWGIFQFAFGFNEIWRNLRKIQEFWRNSWNLLQFCQLFLISEISSNSHLIKLIFPPKNSSELQKIVTFYYIHNSNPNNLIVIQTINFLYLFLPCSQSKKYRKNSKKSSVFE